MAADAADHLNSQSNKAIMGGSSNTTTAPAATAADQDSSATASLARRVITRITGGGIGGGSSGNNNNAESGTYVRRAHHAGSWYSSNTKQLNTTLGRYLSNAEEDLSNSTPVPGGNGMPRGIISPHAGYDYSGPSAAYSYLALREFLTAEASAHHHSAGTQQDTRIVVLHPSHHVYLSGAAVSGATEIQTPLGNLCVDDNLRQSLVKTGKFSTMERHVDEAEHSGEMQYPYIAKVINDVRGDSSTSFHVKVLPIMIGATSTSQEQKFGRILASFLAQPHVFTVVSSDFCHWGKRFSYYPHLSTNPDDGMPFNQIADYIEWLDRKGMTNIEMQNPGAFATYLKEHSNTICGRHPIAVWLESVAENGQSGRERVNVAFVKYDQSSRVSTVDESSVSYASAVARLATVGSTERS